MKNLWQYVKSLFQEAEQSSPSQPSIHQLIERSTEEKEDFLRWKESLVSRRMLNWLNEQYIQYLINPDNLDEAIDFLKTPSAKGFVVHFGKTRYPRREVVHLFDFLKERVLQQGYRPYVSDTRTYNRPAWVETVQRHYLKPPSQLRQLPKEKFDQKYGNITIQLTEQDGRIMYLKFNATSYKDHLFADAEDFKDLMTALLAA
ncbi:MAG: hypothetical protein AAF990_14750 [Bacteroidota bacterium]